VAEGSLQALPDRLDVGGGPAGRVGFLRPGNVDGVERADLLVAPELQGTAADDAEGGKQDKRDGE
jgi:hypothetical protein